MTEGSDANEDEAVKPSYIVSTTGEPMGSVDWEKYNVRLIELRGSLLRASRHGLVTADQASSFDLFSHDMGWSTLDDKGLGLLIDTVDAALDRIDLALAGTQ